MSEEEVKKDNTAELLAAIKETNERLERTERANLELRQALISGNTDGIGKVSKAKGHTAHVRVVDGQAVVAFKNKGIDSRPTYIYTRQDPNDHNKMVNYVDIVLEDGTVVPVNHIEFLNEAPRVECQIVSRKEHHWISNKGRVTKKEVKDYDTVELDEEVDQVVKGVTFDYTLKLPEEYGGREVVLSDNYGLING